MAKMGEFSQKFDAIHLVFWRILAKTNLNDFEWRLKSG